jgi:peptide/nickel transport system permease protein
MLPFVLRRLALAVPSVVGISVLTFILIRAIPGSAVDYKVGTSMGLDAAQVAVLKHHYGLDEPLWRQYFIWMGGVVHGDLGVSMRSGTSVLDLIVHRFPATLELSAGALAIALLLGVPLGILSALRTGGLLDAGVRIGGLVGLSMPNFWLATMLIALFSTAVRWLPNALPYATLSDDPALNLQQNVLPSVVLGIGVAGSLMRITRASVRSVLAEDYVLTARAKGLLRRQVLVWHVVRNGLIPLLTMAGVMAGYLLTGAVIIEQIFNVPGVGRLLLTSILQRDYPVMEGAVLLIAVVFVLTNLVADVLYGLADPRIRQG